MKNRTSCSQEDLVSESGDLRERNQIRRDAGDQVGARMDVQRRQWYLLKVRPRDLRLALRFQHRILGHPADEKYFSCCLSRRLQLKRTHCFENFEKIQLFSMFKLVRARGFREERMYGINIDSIGFGIATCDT